MDNKKQVTDYVEKVKKGSKDTSGNIVKEVLVKQNEFVIYEIESNDINNSLKVFIDGHTNDSEEVLIQKFNKVKQNYIKAKGLLYRSTNFGMMKNRIAHLLSTVLSSTDEGYDGNQEFKMLIFEIEKEYAKSITHRLVYLIPSVLFSIGISFYIYLNYLTLLENNSMVWEIICVLFGSIIGGTMSIIFRISKNNFEEHLNSWYYFFTGIERIILSIFAGIIAYIGIKSGIFLGNVENKDYWTIAAISILAGFAEALIPGLLTKVANEKIG